MKRLRIAIVGIVFVAVFIFGTLSASASPPGWYRNRSAYLVIADENDWKWDPVVAYDSAHDEYLVVWETIQAGDHHVIDARRVSASGYLYPEFTVYDDTYNSLQPAVAYDSVHDRYLVVWSYDSAGDGSDNDIDGRFIPWNGPNTSELMFGIDESRQNSDKPRLAYSALADEFLIVWKVEETVPFIAGGMIYHDKTGISVAISDGDGGTYVKDFPDVAYNAARHEFAVVWDEDVGRGSQDLDIHGIRLSDAGATLTPGDFSVTTSTSDEQHPAIAACAGANEYLIAWQQEINSGPDDNIYSVMMSGTGSLANHYVVEGTSSDQASPGVSCNLAGTEFFMAWNDYYASPTGWGIWATVVHTDFTDEPGFDIVAPSWTNSGRFYPQVASGRTSTMVVWQHARDNTNYLDVWGLIVRPHTELIPAVMK